MFIFVMKNKENKEPLVGSIEHAGDAFAFEPPRPKYKRMRVGLQDYHDPIDEFGSLRLAIHVIQYSTVRSWKHSYMRSSFGARERLTNLQLKRYIGRARASSPTAQAP